VKYHIRLHIHVDDNFIAFGALPVREKIEYSIM